MLLDTITTHQTKENTWTEGGIRQISSSEKSHHITIQPSPSHIPFHHSRPTFYRMITSLQQQDMSNHRSITSFRITIFIQEFIIHVFGPLCWPYCRFFMGPWAYRNRLFHIIWGGGTIGNYVWALAVTMQVLYFISSTSEVRHVFPAEVVISTCIFLSRATIIAAKYAYLAPITYRESCEKPFTMADVLNNLLLTAWGHMSLPKIASELHLSIERSSIDIQHLYLTFIDDSHKTLISTLTSTYTNSQQEGDDPQWIQQLKYGRVHAMLLLRHMFVDANETQPSVTRLLTLCRILAFIHVMIPCIIRLSYGWLPLGENPKEVVIIGGALIVGFLNFFANIAFIGIGILDFNRRIYVMHQLSSMLTSKYEIWQTKQSHHMPIIDLTSSTNFANWMDLRTIAKNFGLQFHLRIQAYASLWSFFLIIFVAYLLIQVIFPRTADLVSIILAVYDVVIVATVLFIMLFFAKTLNGLHDEHHLILLRTEGWLQRQCDGEMGLSHDDITRLKRARDMIEIVTRVVDRHDKTTPVTIMGFDVSNGFLRVIIGIVTSGLLAGARLIIT